MIADAYFDRFETPKYRNPNPVQRALIRRFVERVWGLVERCGRVERVLEVGVGEGFLSGVLAERLPHARFTGVDLRREDLDRMHARFPAIEPLQGDVCNLGFLREPFDLVLCCEVLEHVDEPERALLELAQVTRGHAVLSVPHEPWFLLANLARGKNLTRLGNDPEHVQRFGPRRFRRLVAKSFEPLLLERSFPWLLALGAPRHSAAGGAPVP